MKKDLLPNLNPLRGFLAILVVLLHIPLMTKNFNLPYYNDWPVFNRGYEAVWVFFTLSGFLIIRLLYLEKEKTDTVNIVQFYWRRIFRIYPVYYLVLFFGLLFYFFIVPNIDSNYSVNYTLTEALIWCIAFFPNVLFAYFDPGAILSVLWSIGIEEQFYLVIAPISKFINKNRFTLYLLFFSLLYFIFYFIPEFEILRKLRMQYFYFTFGGLIAILHYQGRVESLIFKPFLRVILYLIFFFYFFTDVLNFEDQIIKHAIGCVLFPLTILNCSNETKWIIKNRFLNYLGEISFGIYMYHMIALNVVLFIMMKLAFFSNLNDVLFIIIENMLVLGLTVILASLSYHYFEIKFIKMKKRNFSKDTQNSQNENNIKIKIA